MNRLLAKKDYHTWSVSLTNNTNENEFKVVYHNELQIEPEFIVNDELDKDHLQIFKNIKKNAETQYAMQNKSKNRFGQPV